MNDQHDSGLDGIWPRVSAEIESERRKDGWKRKTLGKTATGLGVLATAGVVFMAVTRIWLSETAEYGRSDSWQLADVSLTSDNRSEYPVVRNQRVFAVRREGNQQHVICVEKLTGKILWTSDLQFQECRLTADDNRVYVLARTNGTDWLCAALEAPSGRMLWSRTDNVSSAHPPLTLTVLPTGICWTRKGELIVRNCKTGDPKWSATLGVNEMLSTPVEHYGNVFTTSRNILYALSSDSGDRLWSQTLANNTAVFAPLPPFLKVSAGKLIVACRSVIGGGVLHCVDLKTREVLWTQETPIPTNLHADAEHIYLRSQTLGAYDVKTGTLLWTAKVGGCGPLAFQDGRVYLTDPKEHYSLVALDARLGKPVWRHSTVASCGGIVVNGKIGFVSGNDGRLHAVVLGAERKSRIWQYL